MNPNQQNPIDPDQPQLPTIRIHHPSSPRHPPPHPHHHYASTTASAAPTPTDGARRKIGVAVDLSDESAYAVRWAVDHYIRPGDAVILLHVSPTSVLFGADWGPLPLSTPTHRDREKDNYTLNENKENESLEPQEQEPVEDIDAFTAAKAGEIAKPLKEAQIPYKIHIAKDHDMKERLCLEVERLGLSAVILGSRGFGAVKRGTDGRLGSVSDYCVHHCVCPVVVVRYPDDSSSNKDATAAAADVDAVINVPVNDDNADDVAVAKSKDA